MFNFFNRYKLIPEDKIEIEGHTLYRIKALKFFSDVKKGDLGGYIESIELLPQQGNSWVYDNSKLFCDNNNCVFFGLVTTGTSLINTNLRCNNVKIYGNVEILSIKEYDIYCKKQRLINSINNL